MNESPAQPWHHAEQGTGRPLILLHGIGMSHVAWRPVMTLLASAERRVIAFDIAGFGRTPALPAGVVPTHANLALALRESLHGLGVDEPADLVGNSLGGQLALEAAKIGLARSVVALSPAGLWPGRDAPPQVHATLRATRWAIRQMPHASEQVMRSALGRTLALMLPMTSRGWRLTRREALEIAQVFAQASAFEETLQAATRFVDGRHLCVPITVAFGTRDWLLTRSCQRRDELPRHVRWVRPEGWGHVPMWDDPEGVAALILEGSA
ncbi:alpha/beta fold hydrolase [Panacagrimonas sp.]|uniref:alpha/beta fold hydrolase n=1 Tax=Panacagrimonas sp. TaxID=2480088 RepID=UPI003B52E8A1